MRYIDAIIPYPWDLASNPFQTILRCAGNEDSVKIVVDDNGADVAEFVFENPSADRIANLELKLMDIDSENMNVPGDTDYQPAINIPSAEYRRVFNNLSIIGDTYSSMLLKIVLVSQLRVILVLGL